MAAILNSTMLDSDTAILYSNTLFSSLRFTQKHSHSTLTLTQTNSICLKLIQSDSNLFILTQLDDGSYLEFYHVGFRHCHLVFKHLVFFSQIHSKNTLTPLWLWLKLIQSDSNLMMAAFLNSPTFMMVANLEFCHVGFRHSWLKLILSDQFDDGSHLESLSLLKSDILDSN